MPKNTPTRIIDNKQTRAVAFLGGGGSAGGTTDHGLLLGLSDDDHAQYLRTDGTRTLTGNMAVAAAVTIDGIDISAHAADANAHHAQAHAITGSDHTVTGSQYQIVGLTSTNTLGLLTAASSPTTNQVVKTDGSSGVTLVDLTVTSDLFMTGTLDFGTNTIAEDATYLQFAGSKAVRFNQNVGNANYTLYNAGGYTTTGSISITGTAGDLTVGSNVLFVDNSQANVGINMAPDSQFALDINGPARATYWIGPHAIQLKNVLLLAHYDGRYPYATNYSGEPNGHMGQVATIGGTVVYKAGRFYKAVQTGASTTNRCGNPSFETNTTSWSLTDTNSSATMTRVSTMAYAGTYSLQLLNTSANNDDYASVTISSVSASTAYTISAYVYVTEWVGGATSNRGLMAYDSANAGGTQQLTTITGSTAGEWVRHTVTVTTTSSPGSIVVRLYAPQARVFWDAVQVEAGSATGYCDGDMPGHTWVGTAHASTSTRPDGAYLVYPTSGNINVNVGTVMAWIYPYRVSGAQTVLRVNGVTTGNIILRANGTTLEGFWGTQTISAASQITANTWQHVGMVYDGATLYLYVNGAYVASGTASGFSGTPASMYVGSAYNTNEMLTGLIDDLCILDRAMTIGAGNVCSEMRSVYESNAPVFAETSTFSFRPTPKGLLWADDEGLWMRDTAANPVFGIYGGDATKSWGGFTMAPGDLLIGNNAVGSSAIMWDQSAGTFGFYGAGSATAQVQITTGGYLTAGGGNVTLNSDGAYILTGASVDNFSQAYSFKTAHGGTGDIISSFQGYVDGSANDHGGIRVGRLESGHDADVFVLANSLAGDISTGTFGSVNTSGSNYRSLIVTRADGSTANVQTYIDANIVATIDAKGINGKTLYSSGDSGGVASTVAITNDVQNTSSGTGTIKMNGATSRNSSGWLKIWYGTNAYYVPLFSTVTG